MFIRINKILMQWKNKAKDLFLTPLFRTSRKLNLMEKASTPAKLFAVTLTVFLTLFTVISSAATFTVLNTADSGSGSLREQVTNAASGDTIVFDSGINGSSIVISGYIPFNKNLTFIGNGVNNTIIESSYDRLAIIDTGITVAMSGITMQSFGGFYLGGGVFLNRGILSLSNCNFKDNQAIDGGVCDNNKGSVTAVNCGFYNNTVSSDGGVLHNYQGPLHFTNCTFANNSNTGSNYGGAITNFYGPLTIDNCTFTGNNVVSGAIGGAIFQSGSTLTINHSTFTNNTATKGGAIELQYSNLSINNSMIAGNSATTGPDVDNLGSNLFGALSYNLIGDNTDFGLPSGNGNLLGSTANPINPMLDTLSDNGGSTLTMAIAPCSPAYNAADPADVSADQRGESVYAGRKDIGAFESQASVTLTINCPAALTLQTDSGLCTATAPPSCSPQSNFAGNYAPANWTLVNTNGGTGSVNSSAAPASVTLTGSNNGSSANSYTNYQISPACGGVITFNWSYSTVDEDASWDPFGYILNGVFTPLFSYGIVGNGSATVSVQPGDVFGFSVYTLDNVGGAPSVAISNFYIDSVSTTSSCGIDTITNNAPATFPVGITTVTWTATDVNGNTATCTQNVTVTDNQPPLITCPADITLLADSGLCTATAPPSCSPQSNFAGNYSPANWNLTNTNGGTGSVNTSTAPASVTLTGSDNGSADFSYTNYQISPTCGGVITFNWSYSTVDEDALYDPFGYILNGVFTPLFNSGISGNGSATVSVQPGDLFGFSINSTDNSFGAATTVISNFSIGPITATATDACGIDSITSDAPATFPVGITTVTWTATDVNGNTATCTQNVTVTDNQPPHITCPGDITVSTDSGLCSASGVVLGTPSVSDNCGVDTVTNNAPMVFAKGITTVTWIATDIHGNTATCTQLVTVLDTIAPTAVCQSATVYLDATGNASIAVAAIDGGSADNCGIASLSASQTAFTCANTGANTVILTVTDSSGNSSSCSTTVTVLDTIAPTAVCQSATVYLDATGNASIAAAAIDGGSADNCGIASLSASQTAFTCANTGANTVILTVTDSSGNSSSCSTTVTVLDTIAPSILCPLDVVTEADAGQCSASNVNLSTPTALDNCGIDTVTSDAPSVFPVGTTIVTWTATDHYGNTASCVQMVTVNSSIDTSVTFNGTTFAANDSAASYQWYNCSTNTVVAGATGQTFTPTSSGSYTVILTQGSCSDTSGCFNFVYTSISNHLANSSIKVFPNPASDVVYIQSVGSISGTVQIQLYDLTGKLVRDIHLKNMPQVYSLSLDQLASEAYELRIQTTQGVWNAKVMKVQ